MIKKSNPFSGRILLLTTALFSAFYSAVSYGDWTTKIYDLGSKSKLLYTSVDKEEKNGDLVTGHVTFNDPQGKEAVREDYTLQNGKLIKYTLHQRQVNEEGTLEVKDGRTNFSYTKEGKTSTDDEKAVDNLVTGPVIIRYIQGHWDEIMKGDTVDVRWAALDRKETVGFKFFKMEEKQMDGKNVVLVKMKPTSIVIAAIVDPLIIIFERDSKKLLEIKGRTLPRQMIDGHWKDLDADTLFSS